jgi:hypothetical protein
MTGEILSSQNHTNASATLSNTQNAIDRLIEQEK